MSFVCACCVCVCGCVSDETNELRLVAKALFEPEIARTVARAGERDVFVCVLVGVFCAVLVLLCVVVLVLVCTVVGICDWVCAVSACVFVGAEKSGTEALVGVFETETGAERETLREERGVVGTEREGVCVTERDNTDEMAEERVAEAGEREGEEYTLFDCAVCVVGIVSFSRVVFAGVCVVVVLEGVCVVALAGEA